MPGQKENKGNLRIRIGLLGEKIKDVELPAGITAE